MQPGGPYMFIVHGATVARWPSDLFSRVATLFSYHVFPAFHNGAPHPHRGRPADVSALAMQRGIYQNALHHKNICGGIWVISSVLVQVSML